MKSKAIFLNGFSILTLLMTFFCSAAVASEVFLVSAANYHNLVLNLYKVDGSEIQLVRSNTIATKAPFGIFNTAVLYRTNKPPVFDVYYGVCQDFECVEVKLSLKRLDSNLNVVFEKDDITSPEYWWTTVGLAALKLEKTSGTSYRILMGNGRDDCCIGDVAERQLNSIGIPGAPINVAFRGDYLRATAAEDAKMVVAVGVDRVLKVRTMNPLGKINKHSVSGLVNSLALSGPITSSSEALKKPYRLLLYRINEGDPYRPISRIMMQKIDNATGKFLGAPAPFKIFSTEYIVSNWKSVAVTPAADIIIFTKYDASCRSHLLWAQRFNPQTFKKVGPAQLLIGCNDPRLGGDSLDGIAITQK